MHDHALCGLVKACHQLLVDDHFGHDGVNGGLFKRKLLGKRHLRSRGKMASQLRLAIFVFRMEDLGLLHLVVVVVVMFGFSLLGNLKFGFSEHFGNFVEFFFLFI